MTMMRNRRSGKRIAAAVGLLVALAPAARARACETEAGLVIGVGAAALFAPSEIGVAVSPPGPSTGRLVIGWSWQVPISLGEADNPIRHRIVGSVDLLPHSGGASWRGRLGYRYARRHAFGGAGVGLADGRVNLSPEIGVKFLHDAESTPGEMDLSMHLLARAELGPESGQLRGATILLGWNLL
jgi:hypothetical protein